MILLIEVLVDCESLEQLWSRLQPGNTLHLMTQVRLAAPHTCRYGLVCCHSLVGAGQERAAQQDVL
jgi:hypothetical protein